MISWNETWMNVAEEISKRSKDPSTHVGAVIVKDKQLLSLGYNGAPKSFLDEDVPQTHDNEKPLIERKNTFMLHAELNAILNYKGALSDLRGATCYVTVSPCFECAKALVQVGISNVIYKTEYHRKEQWEPSLYILQKCGITVQKYDDVIRKEN